MSNLAISRSVYPEGWDPKSTEGFNDWINYVYTEARLADEPSLRPTIKKALSKRIINRSNLVIGVRHIFSLK